MKNSNEIVKKLKTTAPNVVVESAQYTTAQINAGAENYFFITIELLNEVTRNEYEKENNLHMWRQVDIFNINESDRHVNVFVQFGKNITEEQLLKVFLSGKLKVMYV